MFRVTAEKGVGNTGLAYVAGLVAADGSIEVDEPCVYIACKNKDNLTSIVAPLLKKVSGKHVSVFYDQHAGVYKAKVYDRHLQMRLIEHFRVPAGDKAERLRPPDNLKADEENSYIRGWFDGEGWCEMMRVRRNSKVYEYPRVGFKVRNEKIVGWIWLKLNALGIRCSKYSRKDGSYGIWVNGIKPCVMFREKIGFNYVNKSDTLNLLIARARVRTSLR